MPTNKTNLASGKPLCCTPEVLTKRVEKPEDPQALDRGLNPPDYAFIALNGGTFIMGAGDGPHPEDGEGPVREVSLDGFGIASVTVTNADYAKFVDATGYSSFAEREGASFVFYPLAPDAPVPVEAIAQAPWWRRIEGACWRWPVGLDGIPAGEISDHPVVHIALPDTIAYCQWSGTRLPTEAQWEYAARGGLQQKPYPWGDDLEPNGQHRCNVWQGHFPNDNTATDGHLGTAPIRSYEPNGFGLFEMTGNVWEWTADRFTTLHSPRPSKNPAGPLNGTRFVAKGGSYLCHHSYCTRYRTSSRQALDPNTTASNVGFRVCALTTEAD